MDELLFWGWVSVLTLGPPLALAVPRHWIATVPIHLKRGLMGGAMAVLALAGLGIYSLVQIVNHAALWVALVVVFVALAQVRQGGWRIAYVSLVVIWTLLMLGVGWVFLIFMEEPFTESRELGHGFVARQRTYGILDGSGYEVQVMRRLGPLPLAKTYCVVRFRAMGPWPDKQHPTCTVRLPSGEVVWQVRPLGDAVVTGLDMP